MRDAAATRDRIIVAATAEFAERGIAGARVDRIAAAASTSKPQIYSYFGNKDQLFDIIFDAWVERNVDQVPLDADDLPGYAVRLYDAYLAESTLVRLATWARLERETSGDLFARNGGIRTDVVDRIRAGQERGIIDPSLAALDVFCLVIAMAGTWAQASITITASPADPAAEHDRRRAALALAVERAFAPRSRPAATTTNG